MYAICTCITLHCFKLQYVGKGVAYTPDEPGRWVCDFLELPHTRLDIVLDAERSKAFQQVLLSVLLSLLIHAVHCCVFKRCYDIMLSHAMVC
jgi:hypothetical protein